MTLALFLIPIFMYGQDTIYLDATGTMTKDKLLAMNYRIISPDSIVSDGLIEREYYLSGKLKSVAHKVTVLNEKSQKKKVVWEGKFQQ